MLNDDERHELLTGWGRTTWSASEIVTPRTASDIESALRSAGPRGALGRGLGRSYGDAAMNSGGVVISTSALDQLSTGDLVVGAGVSLRELLVTLLPHGLTLPVLPGTAEVSVGGAIAADVHGKNHHVDGAFSEHVASFRLATSDGVIEVSRESEPEVFNATAGGMGLTGVIVDARLTTEVVESGFVMTDTDRATDIAELMSLMCEGDDEYKFSVTWVDCFAKGKSLGRGVLARGNYAPRELTGGTVDVMNQFEEAMRPRVPDFVPTGALLPLAVRAFNEFRFRRAPLAEREKPERFSTFFHPLDVVSDWNRLYGRAGFVQYQFVVPFGSEGVVERVLAEQLTTPSYLAVLKRMGVSSGGMLSFPMPGWTLALDFPAHYGELPEMLDRFDRWVVEAGGRVYLAKDARMSAAVFREMYPKLGSWQEIRNRIDPGAIFSSDLSRRLGMQEH